MQIYHDLEAMDAAVAAINSADTEAVRIDGLCSIALNPSVGDMAALDPFSPAYRSKVLDLYKRVSGRTSYTPQVNELSPYLEDASKDDCSLGCYTAGSTRFVGDLMAAMGDVLRALDAPQGCSILEYGAGEGGISLEAAKCGCDVTVVDIEAKYLIGIKRRATAAGVPINVLLGEFGHDCGRKFDRILFYEAFHHALDHAAVARKIAGMLSPGGYLVLAGEPIIGPHNEQWRATLPYPWGLRLDGLSYRAIKTYGWLELGFDMGYLIEMLMRAGFLVEFRESAGAGERGSVYIARPYAKVINLGDRFTIAACGRYGDWHEPEGDYRWTARAEAVLPTHAMETQLARLSFANYSGESRPFEFQSGELKLTGLLAPGETRAVALPVRERIYIRAPLFSPGGSDTRRLGLAVKTLEFVE